MAFDARLKDRRAGAILFKGIATLAEWYWTLRNQALLRLIWKLEGGVRFRGRIFVRSASGKVSVGAGTEFGPSVNVEAARGATLVIGKRVSVNQGAFVVAFESITIGDDSRIGEYASIRDNDHAFADADRPIVEQGFVARPVRIGRDVWIGRAAVIQKGVTIGDGAVIGAGAVVTHDVTPYSIVVGVPARHLRYRNGRNSAE